MNLLMILLIVLAIWICGAICYFAWRLTPSVPTPEDRENAQGLAAKNDDASVPKET